MAKVAGFVFAGVAVLQVLLAGTLRRLVPALVCVTAFTVWAAISVLRARVVDYAVVMTLTYVQLLLFLWLGWQVVRTRVDWNALAGGYVAGCAIAAVASWMASRAGVSYSGEDYDPRYAAFGFDPNDMSVTISLAIPLAVHLGVRSGSPWSVGWLAYLPVALTANILTGSRGGAITTMAALAGAAYVGREAPGRLKMLLGGLLMAGVLAASIAVPPETWKRIVTVRDEVSTGTLSERAPIWRAGLQVFLDHPLVGVGVGGFQDAVVPALGREMVAHNTFLSVAAELGLVGLALFLGAFLAILRTSSLRQRGSSVVYALFATWSVGVQSLTWEYRKTTWLVLLLAMTAAGLDDGPVNGEGRGERHPVRV